MASQAECESCFYANVLIFTFILRCSKKRFSRGVLANTDRSLRFFLRTFALFIAPGSITDFGIAQAKHYNLIFCSFVLRID